MIFNAIDSSVYKLLRYYRNSIWIYIVAVLISGLFVLTAVFLKGGVVPTIFFSIALAFVYYKFALSRIVFQAGLLNHFVYSINATDSELSIITLEISAFMGIIYKKPISVYIKSDEIRLRKANENFGNAARNGTVYLLTFQSQEFAVAEKFFIDFEILINDLERYRDAHRKPDD